MIETSKSITIDRPIEEVFAYVTDTSNDPAWHSDILEARKTSKGPIGRGTTWRVRFKPVMGVSEGDMEVVAFEANRKEVQQGAMGPMQPTLTYLFEPAGGGTRFTRRVEIKVSGMMRLIEPLMSLMTPRGNARFLANLKKVLEERSAAG